MSNTPARERSPLAIAAAIVAALPLLYVLSIGPAAWLESRGLLDARSPLLALFYAPLHALGEYCVVCREVIGWWISIWD